MKTYRVTVNGNVYDVSVEELAAGAAPVVAAPIATPVAAPTATPAPVAAAPAAPKTADAGQAGSSSIVCPMPGLVLDIKVAVGDAVGPNKPVIILEAMKMENEIVMPSQGKIMSIPVSKGDTVNTGDILLTYS